MGTLGGRAVASAQCITIYIASTTHGICSLEEGWLLSSSDFAYT